MPHVAHAGDVIATRGQRCPAAVNIGRTPVNPGRTPAVTGYPVPTVDARAMPAAVVEGRPSPAVCGMPVPADIAVNPAPPVAVRPPAGVHSGDCWPPDPAVSAVINPVAVRGE